MNESTKTVQKRVRGLKGSVAQFKRPRDGQLIHVFPRRGENSAAAITRVMKHNGAEGGEYVRVA